MSYIKLVLNIFLLLALINVCFSDESVEVKLDLGVVLGKVEKTLFKSNEYHAFRGIPFAAAPIEELRFKPPTGHKGWIEPLEAFYNKPTCLQYSARMRMHEPYGISGSEDCLFINIFTPNIQGNAPVIVFDYNDSFKTGFNGSKTYSPENFLEEGVTVVTIANRLGIFGYLTTEDEVIPGNNGLRDFVFGLEWIQDNIKNFGGDPTKVTLMGSVGGGALVNMLLYSEKAKGLFSGAIIQSGNALETLWFPENTRSKAFELGENVGIDTKDSEMLLKELQKIDTDNLFKAMISVLSDLDPKSQKSTHLFTPVIEHNSSDAVLSILPEKGVIVNDVPVIIGFNSREGLDFTSHFLFDPKHLTYHVQESMLKLPIRTEYTFDGNSKVFEKARQEIVEFYLSDRILDFNTAIEYSVFAGDVLLAYSQYTAGKILSESINSPVYFYMFDYLGHINENSLAISRYSRYPGQNYGATVADELCYLLICNRIREYYTQLREMPSEQLDQKVLKRMVRMWSNFAKTRNPTPSGDEILKGFSWEPVSKDTGFNYLHVTKKLRMETDPLDKRREFWDNFIAKYAEMAVDGIVKDEEEHDEL